MPENPRLTAFYATRRTDNLLRIVPAPRWREWMEATTNRFANRCLPLLVANESGWVLLNPVAFEATWDGGEDQSAIKIEFAGDVVPPVRYPVSHFGHGVLSWSVPYLFRTADGWNLLARGPANWPKDGISALEGIVETDWSVATFTMNWRFTRPNHPVTFEEDEPFCMIVPQRRGELESFEPDIRDVRSDPETLAGWKQWHGQRDELQRRKFLGDYSAQYEEDRDAWERDYFKGRLPDGRPAPAHVTKRRLPDFKTG